MRKIDPAILWPGFRVISLIGLPETEQRQSFVNQLQMALFSWIKRNRPGTGCWATCSSRTRRKT